MRFYLYRITNLLNNKHYFGVTRNPRSRWQQHCSSSSNCRKLKNAICEYGKDNFTFTVLVVGKADYIYQLEPKIIEKYNSVTNGYNTSSGGGKGSELVIENRVTDSPVYVSGFWFKSDRQARRILKIPKRTYFQRKKDGNLGKTKITTAPNNKRVGQPVFVKDFWFPSVKHACLILGLTQTTVNRKHRESTRNSTCQKD